MFEPIKLVRTLVIACLVGSAVLDILIGQTAKRVFVLMPA
jgi:hypothetical protein